jgi:hypothetical protein
MVRYFYAWIPLASIWTLLILTLPWLGLIAFMVLLFAAVSAICALGWAFIASVHALGRLALGRLIPRRSRAWRDDDQPLALNTRGVGERVAR